MPDRLFESAEDGAVLNVVIRITRPDGSTEELTVHKVVIDPEADDNHGMTLSVENDWGDHIDDRYILRKNTAKVPVKTMEVTFRGRLEQADPGKDVLYQVIRTPAPEESNDG